MTFPIARIVALAAFVAALGLLTAYRTFGTGFLLSDVLATQTPAAQGGDRSQKPGNPADCREVNRDALRLRPLTQECMRRPALVMSPTDAVRGVTIDLLSSATAPPQPTPSA